MTVRTTHLRFAFTYSEKYINEYFVGTGEWIEAKDAIVIEALTLSKEARIAFAETRKEAEVIIGNSVYFDLGQFDKKPELSDICERLEWRLQGRRAKVQQIKDEIVKKENTPEDQLFLPTIPTDLEPYFDDLSKEWQQRYWTQVNRIKAALDAREQEEIALEKARKEQEEALKLEWIAVYGSPRLKKAVANDYDCTFAYATERAALERPEFELDYGGNLKYADRSCPTEAALDFSLNYPNSRVAWVKRRHDTPVGTLGYQGEEAVILPGFLGKYNLVKYFGDKKEGSK